jgi:predicted dithiol-disulfide oxidoreductase (DUF899 family)
MAAILHPHHFPRQGITKLRDGQAYADNLFNITKCLMATLYSSTPMMNAYAPEDGTVCPTYPTTARRPEFMTGYYGFLDRAPIGHTEGTPRPWRSHGEYHDANAWQPRLRG